MDDRSLWVVVADEAIARVLARRGRDALAPAAEWTDPAAHASGAALRRDAHGRRHANATSSAGLDESHREADAFAHRVAGHLAEALQQGRYDELRIAAAPRFLGLLRKHLSPPVAARVSQELDKDLVHETVAQIGERLGG